MTRRNSDPMYGRWFALYFALPIPRGAECPLALEAAGFEEASHLTAAGFKAAAHEFGLFLEDVPREKLPVGVAILELVG